MKRALSIPLILILVLTLAAPARAQDAAPSTYLFQVVVLVAEPNGTSSLDDVPPNAQKAIEDVRAFLPFKSYKLCDVGVMRSGFEARGLLDGPNGEDYEWALRFEETRPDELYVREFQLTDMGSDDRRAKRLIGTSFSVQVGETIVVGTSKLDGGGKALVVLFTAVP